MGTAEFITQVNATAWAERYWSGDKQLTIADTMPRFYFDVRDRRSSTIDDDGVDMPDAEAACAQAAVAAAEMLKSLVPCDATELFVAVRDERGQRVGEVTAEVRVTQHA
ncbi:DUF6894 family protein [Tistrella mobilis]|nr:hypothetical protein [Tistrella mobilis]